MKPPFNLPQTKQSKNITVAAYTLAILAALLLSGCGKSAQERTTAERLKNAYGDLEKQQEVEAATQRKPADFMDTIKSELNQSRVTNNEALANPLPAEGKPNAVSLAPTKVEPPAIDNTAPKIAPNGITSSLQAVAQTPSPSVPVAAANAPLSEAQKLRIEPTLVPTLPNSAANALISAAVTRPSSPASAANTLGTAGAEKVERIATASLTTLTKREPEFPVEAKQRGIESGVVLARASVNSAGEVTRVEILSAKPPNVFNRSVVAALRMWTFNAGANDRTYESEFTFRQ